MQKTISPFGLWGAATVRGDVMSILQQKIDTSRGRVDSVYMTAHAAGRLLDARRVPRARITRRYSPAREWPSMSSHSTIFLRSRGKVGSAAPRARSASSSLYQPAQVA